jgi:hypothetical protein
MVSRWITLSMLLVLPVGVAGAQGTLFPTSYTYPSPSRPYGSALADVNADGNLDYVVANSFAGRVSVHFGTGTGQFTPQPTLPVGGNPRAVVVADLNGDGWPDLATANPETDSVAVLLGSGAGGFGAPTLFPTGSFPVWIDAGDLDGDGDADIATGNQFTNSVSVLLGDGAGNLGAETSHPAGASPERIELADVDGDGNLDCVSASWLDSRVAVLRGDGAGGLSLSADEHAPNPKGLAVGDVNLDGKADVVVASSQLDVVYVFLAGAGGTLSAPRVLIGGQNVSYFTSVMLTDASGDGRLDLIVCGAQAKTLTVWIGVGGDFDFAHTSPIAHGSWDAVAGNLNGDGFADVVTSNQLVDSVSSYVSAGVGSWEQYCTAKTNSLGCVPTMWASGTPSVSNVRPFWVYVYNVLDFKVGLFLYAVNGTQASTPFQGGTLCLGPSGIRRTPAKTSGGDLELPPGNCSGKYTMDFNAFAQGLVGGTPAPGLLVLGNTYQLQTWSRDPGFPAPNNSGLSAALDVTPWQ